MHGPTIRFKLGGLFSLRRRPPPGPRLPAPIVIMPRGQDAGVAKVDDINAREELENLQRVFASLASKEVGDRITKEVLYKTLKRLQFPNLTMAVVEDMIWEVDENCDGMLSWDEFKEMFYRVRMDKIGWEPRRLFNCIEVAPAIHHSQLLISPLQ